MSDQLTPQDRRFARLAGWGWLLAATTLLCAPTQAQDYDQLHRFDTLAEAEGEWDYVVNRVDSFTNSGLQTTNTPRFWNHATGATPSGIGPNGPQAGAGYVYTEASSATALDDEFVMTLTNPVDASLFSLSCSFYFSVDGDGNPVEVYFEVFDGGSWQIEGSWTASDDTYDAWTFSNHDLSAYTNSDLRVRFRVVMKGGTIFWNDTGFDTVRLYGPPRTPPTRVFYSVGTSWPGNLMSGSPTVDISGGTATFSEPQPDDVGVGDVVSHSGGTLVYISGRDSSTVYSVTTVSGGAPGNVTGATVDSITRAFDSLSAAQSGSHDASHLNLAGPPYDLTAGNHQLNWACYDDGPMDDMVDVADWTTGPTNYIRIYTPTRPDQVGASQRHGGTAASGFRLTPADGTIDAPFDIIYLKANYVRLEGLELDGAGLTGAQYVRGITVLRDMSNVGDIRIDSMIIHDLHTTQGSFAAEGSMGILDYHDGAGEGPPLRVTNNIIYDITNTQQVGHIGGIHIGARATSYVSNNTIFKINNFTGCVGDCGPSWGIYAKAWNGGTVTAVVTNNYCGDVTGKNFNVWCYDTESGGVLTQSYNVSSDGSAAGTGSVTGQSGPYSDYFVDVTGGSEDLHLKSTSMDLWGAPGTDLSGSFVHDVDHRRRVDTWDIGADEYFGNPIYYSVGTETAALYSGNASASGGTLTLASAAASDVGVGDEIREGLNRYYINGRRSATEFTIQNSAANGGTAGATNITFGLTAISIYRAFNSLSAAQLGSHDGSHLNLTGPPYDLVAAGFQLNWPCYNDGPMDDKVILDGWTTGTESYIRIFAPNHSAQVGVSQRHTGTAGTGFRLAPVDSTAAAGHTIISIRTPYVRIEGLEIDGSGLTNAAAARGIEVRDGLTNVGDIRIDSSLIHDLHSTAGSVNYPTTIALYAAQDQADTGPPLLITNNIIYGVSTTVFQDNHHIVGLFIGSRTTSYVYNNTIYNIYNQGGGNPSGAAWGIRVLSYPGGTGTATVIAKNNYIGDVRADFDAVGDCYAATDGGVLTQSYNVSSDATATGTGSQTGMSDYGSYFVDASLVGGRATAATDLHLTGTSQALWGSSGQTLSSEFLKDIDGGARTIPWDIGADESDAVETTAVRLASLDAVPLDGAVQIHWSTWSEWENLGFHVYRSESSGGPWERITASLIPGLGTNPEGQAYSWLDAGLANGATYFYRLEDVETSGRVTPHGPVRATPEAGLAGPGTAPSPVPAPGPSPLPEGEGWQAWGDPASVSLRELSRTATSVTFELLTGGVYARTLDDGTTRLAVPGFTDLAEPGRPLLPTRRLWTAAVAGRGVRLAAVQATDTLSFSGVRLPTAGQPQIVAAPDGTQHASFRPVAAVSPGRGSWPRAQAQVLQAAFQGEAKKAYLELAPLSLDFATGQLTLARRLLVHVVFDGTVQRETGSGSRGRRVPVSLESLSEGEVLVRFSTRARGIHAVSFDDAFGSGASPLRTARLALRHRGDETPFRVSPRHHIFGPGSVLHFFADDASEAYSGEAVYELVLAADAGGTTRRSLAASDHAAEDSLALASDRTGLQTLLPDGLSHLVGHDAWEENTAYFPSLLDARDPWQWDRAPLRSASPTKTVPFSLPALAAVSDTAHLTLDLQGLKDDPFVEGDHHVLVRVNGALVGEVRFDGLVTHTTEIDFDSALLVPGENALTLERGSESASLSMVQIDRFSLNSPRALVAQGGVLEGRALVAGIVSAAGFPRGSLLLDLTSSRWLPAASRGATGLHFVARPGHRYFAAAPSAIVPCGTDPGGSCVVRPASPNTLRDTQNQTDWIVLTPRDFLAAAEPLVLHRQAQGLAARAVAIEDVYDAFSGGETDPQAIRDFLALAFHSWAPPAPRYVLLLGEATYDPRGYSSTIVRHDLLPTPLIRSDFLWTASDLLYASVNGEDTLPDLAVGRLNANDLTEAQNAVQKILDFENAGYTLDGRAVLVADVPDQAGSFEAEAQSIASLMPTRSVQTVFRSQVGDAATHDAITAAFDDGAALMSFVGHGSYRLWASSSVFIDDDVDSLLVQARQPLVLTLTCSTGYFVPPHLNSITERLVLAPAQGAIAALSPSTESFDDAAHLFHQALVQQLESGEHSRLGDLVFDAQVQYAASGAFPHLLDLFHTFGDPGLKIR